MFSKFVVLVLAASVALATNQPGACNTGPVQCCKQLSKAGSHDATNILSPAGIPVQSADGFVGADCSPITLIGAGKGANCANSPVCCTQNNIGGSLISTGCTPINVAA